MKTIIKNKLTLFVVLLLAVAVFAPSGMMAVTTTYSTTLASAVNGTQTTITVAAVTNMVASSQTVNSLIYCDGELMKINTLNTTSKVLGVTRGYDVTNAPSPPYTGTHPSGALCYFSVQGGNNSSGGPFVTTDPYPGSVCSTANYPYLPLINIANQKIWNCVGSLWISPTVAVQQNIISGLGATKTLTSRESGSLIILDKADGIVLTLPAPTVGLYYDFVVLTSVTTNAYKFSTATQGTDWFVGPIISDDSDTGDALVAFQCNGSSHDNVSMNGTTTGGIKGTFYRVKAISTTLWHIEGTDIGSSTVATPCSTS